MLINLEYNMKNLTILTILLISTLFVSCSKDEDNDPKYNWELKINYRIVDENDNLINIDSYPSSEFNETDIIKDKSENDIYKYLEIEFGNDKDCNFFYCKKKKHLGTPSVPYYYEERTGTLRRIN